MTKTLDGTLVAETVPVPLVESEPPVPTTRVFVFVPPVMVLKDPPPPPPPSETV
jgi:hypothetical protein